MTFTPLTLYAEPAPLLKKDGATEQMNIHLEPQGEDIASLPDRSVLDALRKKKFDIIASICGGEGTCGKCRIKITGGRVNEPTEEELRILSSDELAEGVRLACQTIPLGPLSLEIIDKALSVQYKTRLAMELEGLQIDPAFKKIFVQLPFPTLSDQTADAERLLHRLNRLGEPAAEIHPLLLRTLPKKLRQADWQITATLSPKQIIDIEPGNTTHQLFGIAFDLGTTTVAAYLLDLNEGCLLDQAAITNHQSSFGEDVMTRIDRAHSGDLAGLQAAALSSMNELLAGLINKTGVRPENIYESVIVGNTCMHHLLLGIDPYRAGIAPFTPAVHAAPEIEASFLGLEIAPHGNVHLPPVISGFVGSDTIGDILALDLDRPQPPHLLIDIGTNAEMALAVDGRIVACSAAAGPAFEGARISCGMRAAPGAVDRAVLRSGTLEAHTIGNKPARGVAGSGLISIAAALKRAGLLNRRGGLRQKAIPAGLLDPDHRGIIVAPGSQTASGKPLVLSWRDLGEELVIARAAIRTGIEILLEETGIGLSDLAGISIAGAFGNFLDIGDALTIGLLPDIPPGRITGVGNAAGKGAVQILLSTRERERARQCQDLIRYVELSGYPDFNRKFSANMKV